MTAPTPRMEKVRRALDHMKSGTLTELFHAPALAEVEFWEAEAARQDEMWSVQSRIIRLLADEVSDNVRSRILAPLAVDPTAKFSDTKTLHDGGASS